MLLKAQEQKWVWICLLLSYPHTIKVFYNKIQVCVFVLQWTTSFHLQFLFCLLRDFDILLILILLNSNEHFMSLRLWIHASCIWRSYLVKIKHFHRKNILFIISLLSFTEKCVVIVFDSLQCKSYLLIAT